MTGDGEGAAAHFYAQDRGHASLALNGYILLYRRGDYLAKPSFFIMPGFIFSSKMV